MQALLCLQAYMSHQGIQTLFCDILKGKHGPVSIPKAHLVALWGMGWKGIEIRRL